MRYYRNNDISFSLLIYIHFCTWSVAAFCWVSSTAACTRLVVLEGEGGSVDLPRFVSVRRERRLPPAAAAARPHRAKVAVFVLGW